MHSVRDIRHRFQHSHDREQHGTAVRQGAAPRRDGGRELRGGWQSPGCQDRDQDGDRDGDWWPWELLAGSGSRGGPAPTNTRAAAVRSSPAGQL